MKKIYNQIDETEEPTAPANPMPPDEVNPNPGEDRPATPWF